MSTAGVFQLIANDGKPDKILQSTGLLNQRLKDVMCARSAQGLDPTPTLLDIERTHVLFVNAHFKPFAAIGFEYNKVRASSGSVTFGSPVQFSIPQFGDFFHDMVLHATLGPCYHSAPGAPTQGAATATGMKFGWTSTYPTAGNSWNNAAIGGNADTAAYTLVDAFGTTGGAATARNMTRYVEYPAERLFANVKFDVNGNPLDEYNYQVANMLRKFTISDEKLVGYKRLVGQEVPFEGFGGPQVNSLMDNHVSLTATGHPTDATHGTTAGPVHGSHQTVGQTPASYMSANGLSGGSFMANQWQSAAATTLTTAQTDVNVGLGTGQDDTLTGGVGPSDSQWGHVMRPRLSGVDGPQTPKYWQPGLELWCPLHFWFNKDARLSIPSVSIPYGQRFITVDLAGSDDIIVDFPGVFVEQAITEIGSNVAADADAAGSVYKSYRPVWQTATLTAPTLALDLYINNIFVNPEIHDIFIRRVGFSLIRVFRRHVSQVTSAESQELLSQLKWPIECLFVGFQPTHNVAKTTNPDYHSDWHRMGKTFKSVAHVRQQAEVSYGFVAANNSVMTSSIGQIVPDTYDIERPTVTTLTLTAHGIKLYDAFPRDFFSAYEPFHYGGEAIRPSTDPNALMMNFALFTGCYQPSGYVNTSRAREFYLNWVSAYISSTTPVNLIAVGIAINFLLVTDGSAVLRYST
jgi:hypothetical protein